jgi:hypothetical protein
MRSENDPVVGDRIACFKSNHASGLFNGSTWSIASVDAFTDKSRRYADERDLVRLELIDDIGTEASALVPEIFFYGADPRRVEFRSGQRSRRLFLRLCADLPPESGVGMGPGRRHRRNAGRASPRTGHRDGGAAMLIRRAPIPSAVPTLGDLADSPIWICWRNEPRAEDPERDQPPACWEFADRVQITRSVLEAQWKALVVPAPSRRLLRHTLLPLALTSSRSWSAYAATAGAL